MTDTGAPAPDVHHLAEQAAHALSAALSFRMPEDDSVRIPELLQAYEALTLASRRQKAKEQGEVAGVPDWMLNDIRRAAAGDTTVRMSGFFTQRSAAALLAAMGKPAP